MTKFLLPYNLISQWAVVGELGIIPQVSQTQDLKVGNCGMKIEYDDSMM